jgi:hypothetical protein
MFQVLSERSWGSVNEDYNRLCNFCAFLDDKISYLILVSFFTNFYFIIFQVFDSLSLHRATPLEIIYYFISLGLLILRMATICVYGSWINEESKISLDLLLSTSHEIYNKEVIISLELNSHLLTTFFRLRGLWTVLNIKIQVLRGNHCLELPNGLFYK